MTTPIALQLYSVRELLAEDFTATVNKVAEIGYAGVETAGFPGTTPKAASKLFDDLGLRVSSIHAPLPLGDAKNETLDLAEQLGCNRIICAALSPETHYNSVDQIKKTCDLVNEASEVAHESGLSLGMHNHWWEFEPVDGTYPYRLWFERLDPKVFFEIDTYWVKTAGPDPVEVIQEIGDRAPLLHIKDGPAIKEEPMLAVGDGIMDVPAIVEAGYGHTEWLVVELDRCATDMIEAIDKSFNYLVDQGLGHGK